MEPLTGMMLNANKGLKSRGEKKNNGGEGERKSSAQTGRE